jgi:hypothetical protein
MPTRGRERDLVHAGLSSALEKAPRRNLVFSQIPPADLHAPILGQLPPADLKLGNAPAIGTERRAAGRGLRLGLTDFDPELGGLPSVLSGHDGWETVLSALSCSGLRHPNNMHLGEAWK